MPGDRELGLVYDAALDPSRWSEVLEMLVDLAGASFGSFSLELAEGGGTGLSVRLDPVIFERYLSISNMTAPLKLGPEFGTGRFVTDRDMAPRETLTASAYYREYLEPSRINSIAAAVLWRGDGLKCCVSLDRSPALDEFDAGHLKALHYLAPHLVRAIGISAKLGDAAVNGALARLPHPVFLLDSDSRIVFANPDGEAVLSARDGLMLVRGRLVPSQSSAAKLSGAVGRAADPFGIGAALRLERPSGRRSLAVLIAPLRKRGGDWLEAKRAQVMVIATDPERSPAPSQGHLVQLYGFTPTEAAICSKIVRGSTLAEIAEQRCISLRTARVHLGHILAKCDVSRQAELVRLVMLEASTGLGELALSA